MYQKKLRLILAKSTDCIELLSIQILTALNYTKIRSFYRLKESDEFQSVYSNSQKSFSVCLQLKVIVDRKIENIEIKSDTSDTEILPVPGTIG